MPRSSSQRMGGLAQADLGQAPGIVLATMEMRIGERAATSARAILRYESAGLLQPSGRGV